MEHAQLFMRRESRERSARRRAGRDLHWRSGLADPETQVFAPATSLVNALVACVYARGALICAFRQASRARAGRLRPATPLGGEVGFPCYTSTLRCKGVPALPRYSRQFTHSGRERHCLRPQVRARACSPEASSARGNVQRTPQGLGIATDA